MNVKTRNKISLTLNTLMFISVLLCVLYRLSPLGMAQIEEGMSIGGTNCFVFFTIDSNILAAIASLILIPYNIKSIKNNKDEIPSKLLTFKFISATSVTLTFIVVVVFLGPIKGYIRMYEGTRLFLHLISPLLSIISYIFFERGFIIPKKKVILGVVPALIYGIVYFTNVLVFKVWPDFYNFNINGKWYITFIVIASATYLMSYIVSKIHNKFEIKNGGNLNE